MSKKAALQGLLAIAIACGMVPPIQAQVTVAAILQFRPKYDDVSYTTPAPADVARCKMENIKGAGGVIGYALLDSDGKLLRKFYDSNGAGKSVDTWSYFQDGEEVYRESKIGNGNNYTFRWMGAGGMKWGQGSVDAAGKVRIETWKMISADEAAKEAFLAISTGDFERMKALMITPQELQALGLPQAEIQRLIGLQTNAALKFQKLRTDMPAIAKSTFSRLENAKPGAYPADMTGGTQDIVKIPSGLILFENATAAKKHDWINSFEMVQLGNAWRLTDIPGPDVVDRNVVPAEILNQLAAHDAKMPAGGKKGQLGPWTVQRIQIVQEIIKNDQPKNQENWYKQIFDNLATAIVDGDATLLPALTKWKTHFETTMPGSNLAAYGAYREIWATYTPEIVAAPIPKLAEVQARHQAALVKFIEAYPKADDTPDALIQLATGSEFSGKEDEAKKWYGQIVANFLTSSNAAKAGGAIRRIDAIGKNFELTGPGIKGGNYSFTPGKITVVYYWASYSSAAKDEFSSLKKLQSTYPKELDVVTVNLDDKAADAVAFLAANPLIAQTLHQPGRNGGMDGPLAAQYGIFGLPHAFLIGADGKMVNNKVQINALEDEIAKLVKK